MDPSKFTEKVNTVLRDAQELARENNHQQLTPVHIAVTMFDDSEGIARQAVLKVANADTLTSIQRTLKRAMTKLPVIEPAPDEVYLSADAKKILQAAVKLEKQKGDSFLGELPGR
jgi:ATP-dependent Clp protease ATP-binding subunit ClpB